MRLIHDNDRYVNFLFGRTLVDPKKLKDVLEQKLETIEESYESLYGYLHPFEFEYTEGVPDQQVLKNNGYHFDSFEAFKEFQERVMGSAQVMEISYRRIKDDIIPRLEHLRDYTSVMIEDHIKSRMNEPER